MKNLLIPLILSFLVFQLAIVHASLKNLYFSIPQDDSGKSLIKRVIVDTTEDEQLKVLQSEGCKVVHKIKPSTALDCPSEVVSKFGLKEDLKVFAVDLNADKQIGAD